jgi:hypothetical protein
LPDGSKPYLNSTPPKPGLPFFHVTLTSLDTCACKRTCRFGRWMNLGARYPVADVLRSPPPIVDCAQAGFLVSVMDLHNHNDRADAQTPNGFPEFGSRLKGKSRGSSLVVWMTFCSNVGKEKPLRLTNIGPLVPWTCGLNCPRVSWWSAGAVHFSF